MEMGQKVEAWFERRRLTLDLAGLDEFQRRSGSIFLGGSAAEFVNPDDKFNYNQVNTIVFRWGDPRAEEVFALMLEHDDTPGAGFFPFSASTLVGDQLWMVVVQAQEFDPTTAYRSCRDYVALPFDQEAGLAKLEEYLGQPIPRPELLGKVGTRWVAFELGTDLNQD